MKRILLNILGLILGAVLGTVVNFALVMISGSVIPLPEGIDPSSAESLAENMHLMGPQHFIMPFLAHALGTLVGAFAAVKIVRSHHMIFAMVIGVFFLAGGIMAATMIPAPTWFIILDLVVSYIPMAWIGWKLAAPKS